MKYLYRCFHCEHRQEEEHSIHVNPAITCEKCGSDKTARVLQPSNFHLKNGGWYKDGYR